MKTHVARGGVRRRAIPFVIVGAMLALAGCGSGGSSSSATGSNSPPGQIEQDPLANFTLPWFDSGPQSPTQNNDSLFQVRIADDQLAYGVETSTTGFSHYVAAAATSWGVGYEFEGELRVGSDSGSVGLTVLSEYPTRSRFYRLEASVGSSFQLTARGTSLSGGNQAASTVLNPDVWYRFRIQTEDFQGATNLRARVWPAGTLEPSSWPIDCFDASATRIRRGTIGCWVAGAEQVDFDNFEVAGSPVPFPAPDRAEVVHAADELYVGETTPLAFVAHYSDQSLDLTNYANWSGWNPALVDVTTTTVTPLAEGAAVVTANFDGVAADPTAISLVEPEPIAVGTWADTAAGNSLDIDESLFRVSRYSTGLVLRTDSTDVNIHSHFVGDSSDEWVLTQYTGRLLIDEEDGGIGVTFASGYPDESRYYRLRRYAGTDFHLTARGAGALQGATETGVVPAADVWYRFRVVFSDNGQRTRIQARVWEDGDVEPWQWSIDAYDESVDRLVEGTVGAWSMGPGPKFWRELAVDGTEVPLPIPTSVSVAVSSSTVALGDSVELVATALYPEGSLDITPEAAWAVSPAGTSLLDAGPPATLTAVSSSFVDVTASLGGVSSPPQSLELFDPAVGAQLVSITIEGPTAALDAGESAPIVATGLRSDGTSEDLTGSVIWTVADPSVAAVSMGSPAVVAGLDAGTTTITASFAGITSAAFSVEVLPSPFAIESIVLTGPSAPLALFETGSLTATAIYFNGSSNDVSHKVFYEATPSGVVSIAGGSPAVVTPESPGTATITASLAGVSSNEIDVQILAPLTGLSLVVPTTSLSIGETMSVEVVANFSDGSQEDVTDQVNWWLGNTSVISVEAGSPATITGETAGTSILAASLGAVGTSPVTIEVAGGTPTLTQLVLASTASQIGLGDTTFLSLTGEFSDGSSVDLTGQATYDVTPSGLLYFFPGAPGIVIGTAEGLATVTASFLGLSSNSIVIDIGDPDPIGLPDVADWIDTTSGSLDEDDSLFGVDLDGGALVLATDSSALNIHSHLAADGAESLVFSEFTGSMKIQDADAGVGITFCSSFPAEDRYYRLRRYAGTDYHLAPHGTSISGGDLSSGVVPGADEWCHFRVQLTDTGTRTEIRAKIWSETQSEPSAWQIDCFDSNSTRLTAGTVGAWSMGPGSKRWGDLTLDGETVPLPQPFVLDVSVSDSFVEIGDTVEFDVVASDPSGTSTVTAEVDWHVEPAGALTFTAGSPAVAEAVESGFITIWAEYEGYPSDPVQISVLPSGGAAGEVNQITSHGITWTFADFHPAGQFVTGDWWVIGPVTVINVSPMPNAGRNGSMVNPMPGNACGYDSRIPYYDSSLAVSYPVTLNPGDSLVSTESHQGSGPFEDLIGHEVFSSHCHLERASVLTVVNAPIPPTTFRPPFVGTDRPLYQVGDLQLGLLPSLAPTSGSLMVNNPSAPTPIQQYKRYFERPWIVHVRDWIGRQAHPTENMPNYHREVYNLIGDASLLVLCDYPDRMDLLIPFVQVGIDMYHSTALGEADSSMNKWCVIFAGIMLDEPAMRSTGYNYRTEWMTYWAGSGGSPLTSSIVPGGEGWTGATALWRQDPGGSEHEHLHPTEWGLVPASGEGVVREVYRRSNSYTWPGFTLAARLMNAQADWDRPVFFDYVDRWMSEPDTGNMSYIEGLWGQALYIGGANAGSNFVESMWDEYR